MASAAEVMTTYGIKRPDVTVRAAAEAGLELAVACVMLMGESGGGRMVWGHDPVDTGGLYTKGGLVTRENYLTYRAAMRAGRIGRQGVGDCQLTSSEFQDRGDQLGGCWDPYANQLAGFIGLADRIRSFGLRNGFRAYNGSGPAAEAYADQRMRELATWRARLADIKERDTVDQLPATMPPSNELGDPRSWPQRNYDVPVTEGTQVSFGVQDWSSRKDELRGFLYLASWSLANGQLIPIDPAFTKEGGGRVIWRHRPTAKYTAPAGAVALTLNYSAPAGAYIGQSNA